MGWEYIGPVTIAIIAAIPGVLAFIAQRKQANQQEDNYTRNLPLQVSDSAMLLIDKLERRINELDEGASAQSVVISEQQLAIVSLQKDKMEQDMQIYELQLALNREREVRKNIQAKLAEERTLWESEKAELLSDLDECYRKLESMIKSS